MRVERKFEGETAVILGTGPSLAKQKTAIEILQCGLNCRVFGINNTFNDFWLDVWIACDPAWHEQYGKIDLPDCDQWHWDEGICTKNGYNHIPGVWADGLSLNPDFIHYGHSSGYQALNLAVLYGCSEILLCGFDMHYNAGKRHYFDNLDDDAGEYPAALRKFSTFGGLLKCYETIAQQWYVDYPSTEKLRPGLPAIYNCTEDSALTCFPFREII